MSWAKHLYNPKSPKNVSMSLFCIMHLSSFATNLLSILYRIDLSINILLFWFWHSKSSSILELRLYGSCHPCYKKNVHFKIFIHKGFLKSIIEVQLYSLKKYLKILNWIFTGSTIVHKNKDDNIHKSEALKR